MKPLTQKQRERLYPKAAEHIFAAIVSALSETGVRKRPPHSAKAKRVILGLIANVLPRASDDALRALAGGKAVRK
jgi:hypothetical protein